MNRKRRLEDFEDTFNPVQVYGYIRDLNANKELSKTVIKIYEEKFYKPILKDIKEKYKNI